ncbi:hypothetical protein ACEQPO_02010 [Bacillus sp. SL00103]
MTTSEHTMIQVSNRLANITENAGQMASEVNMHKKYGFKRCTEYWGSKLTNDIYYQNQ